VFGDHQVRLVVAKEARRTRMSEGLPGQGLSDPWSKGLPIAANHEPALSFGGCVADNRALKQAFGSAALKLLCLLLWFFLRALCWFGPHRRPCIVPVAGPSIPECFYGSGDPGLTDPIRIFVEIPQKDLGALQDAALRGGACTHLSRQIWWKEHRSFDHSLAWASRPSLALIAKRFLNE